MQAIIMKFGMKPVSSHNNRTNIEAAKIIFICWLQNNKQKMCSIWPP